MSNNLISLSMLFQNRVFRIPDYQRGYAWQQTQLVDFWDDLKNLQMDRYHYTGQLSLKLLKQEDVEKWGTDSWIVGKGFTPCHIVDGQQRLTTLVILLHELICFVRELDENSDKIDENICIGDETLKEIATKYIRQIRPTHRFITTYLFGYESDNPSDKYLRHKVFNEPLHGEIEETYYTRNLKVAKDFFANNINELYKDAGMDGINELYQKLTQRLMFNLHEIDDDYDVFVAFETMNNRGKKLTNLELLKNRLIYLTTIYKDEKLDRIAKSELRKQINEAWKEVYHQLGRNSVIALSDDEFLRAHWIIYYSYSRNKGDDYIRYLLNKFSAKNVFESKAIVEVSEPTYVFEDNEEYDDENESENGIRTNEAYETLLKLEPNEISAYVKSMKDLAKHWYYSYFPYDSKSLSDDEKLWIDRLNRISIGYFRPLVTVALSKKSNDKSDRIALFKAIERFIFICFRLGRFRSDYQSTVYYNAANDIYHDVKDIKEVTKTIKETTKANIQHAINGFINDIEKKFDSGNHKGYYEWNSLRYFMFEYEYSLRENTGITRITWEMFSKSENDKVSIEHILPQTPSKNYWKEQFSQYIDNSREMEILTGSLGNLLLLSQSINSSLQNDDFNEKKAPSGAGRRGYKKGSNSEIEVSNESDWDAIRIHDRTRKLLSFMSERWDISLTDDQKNQLAFDDFIIDDRDNSSEMMENEHHV